jgi:hypothetical protein
MSERSTNLRDQADKCRQHAANIGDAKTQEELRKLAAEYIERAKSIESQEMGKDRNTCENSISEKFSTSRSSIG